MRKKNNRGTRITEDKKMKEEKKTVLCISIILSEGNVHVI